jgi:hypothetical protein
MNHEPDEHYELILELLARVQTAILSEHRKTIPSLHCPQSVSQIFNQIEQDIS